jgi:hypothetical protein
MVWRKSPRRLDTLWESGLPAIWRAAAVIHSTHFSRKKCAGRFTAAAQPIATKVCSHRVGQFLRELPQGCEPDAAVAASGVAP